MSKRSVTFTNGEVEIESVMVVHDLPDIFIIEADMRSKYAVFYGAGGGDGEQLVFLGADENTLQVNKESQLLARIVVRGLDGDGWTCVAECARYTAIACWYRRPQKEV